MVLRPFHQRHHEIRSGGTRVPFSTETCSVHSWTENGARQTNKTSRSWRTEGDDEIESPQTEFGSRTQAVAFLVSRSQPSRQTKAHVKRTLAFPGGSRPFRWCTGTFEPEGIPSFRNQPFKSAFAERKVAVLRTRPSISSRRLSFPFLFEAPASPSSSPTPSSGPHA